MKVKLKTPAKASVAARAAHKITKTAKRGFGTVASILEKISEFGIDGATSWLGAKIDSKLVETLVDKAPELSKAKLGAAKGQVLVVDAAKVFAWPLNGVRGDIYERQHDKRTTVRGSLTVLRKHYGESKVKIVSITDALALAAKKKTDAGCLKVLKALIAA